MLRPVSIQIPPKAEEQADDSQRAREPPRDLGDTAPNARRGAGDETPPAKSGARSIVWRSIVAAGSPSNTARSPAACMLRSPSPPPVARLNPSPVFAGPEIASRRSSAASGVWFAGAAAAGELSSSAQQTPGGGSRRASADDSQQPVQRTWEIDEGPGDGGQPVPLRTRIASLARLLPDEAAAATAAAAAGASGASTLPPIRSTALAARKGSAVTRID